VEYGFSNALIGKQSNHHMCMMHQVTDNNGIIIYTDEDLYALAPQDTGKVSSDKFERAWAKQVRKPE